MPSTLRTQDVAAILGITPNGVRLLDSELKPEKPDGVHRVYDASTVARVARERVALRRARSR